MQFLDTVIMGIVEGITEFLPVSSTGHLIITGNFLGLDDEKTKCFEVIIQLGAILSVVFLYWPRFEGLFRFNKSDNPNDVGFRGPREWVLLALTTFPALIAGVLFHHTMKEYLFKPRPVALALAFGGVGILAAEWFKPQPKTESLDRLTWKQALGIGLFQCISLWPGISRAAATIIGGMLCRLERKAAAEYSFLAAVPVMIAATVYDLYKNREILTLADLPMFALGFIVSFIVAALAVKSFIKFLQHWTLIPFAVYRLLVAALFVTLIFMKKIHF